MKTLLLCLIVLAIVSPLSGQGGPVREVGDFTTTLHPLGCASDACFRLAHLLFPTFVAIDPQTLNASTDEALNGLAASWEVTADRTYTVHLREGLTWSDGQPVTAYDVFYSYLAMTSDMSESAWRYPLFDTIESLVPLDNQTVSVVFRHDQCDAPSRLNFPVAPVHYYEPDFAAFAADFFAGDKTAADWQEMEREERRYRYGIVYERGYNAIPPVTYGDFRYEPGWEFPEIRLYPEDAAFQPEGYIYVGASDGSDAADRFIQGEANFIANPPFDRRDDLRALPNVSIRETPSMEWDYIAFNYADPTPDKKEDRGKGQHPIFTDKRVRQAIQLALNIPELMEASISGEGESISYVEFNPREAERLLEAAGWSDTDDNGYRDCTRCRYARIGTPLQFGLLVNTDIPRHDTTAALITSQLREIGISVSWEQTDTASLRQVLRAQTFDAVLDSYTMGWPDYRFLSDEDVLDTGLNFMSYANPEVDDLLHAAERGCDLGLLEQIDLKLREDQAMIWLFRPHDFYAAMPGVRGFDPLPGAPLWNLASWSISD